MCDREGGAEWRTIGVEPRSLRTSGFEPRSLRHHRLPATELDTGGHSLLFSGRPLGRTRPCLSRLSLRGCCLLYSVALLNSVAAVQSNFSGCGSGEDQSQRTRRLRAKSLRSEFTSSRRRSGEDSRATVQYICVCAMLSDESSALQRWWQ